MNNLFIPPSINWYETNVLACSVDNTLVYGARNDIVVVYPTSNETAAEIKVISRAHSQKVTSVDISRKWEKSHKYAVSASEDKIIKIWDLENLEKKESHNKHINHTKVVGANFAGDQKVVSLSENGIIIIWNFVLNEFTTLELFNAKDIITCISICPHATWLLACGLKNGLVAVCDLRKNGKILYKLRGHEQKVTSLSWCPAPINVFPKSPNNIVKCKTSKSSTSNINTTKESLHSSESDLINKSTELSIGKENKSIDLKDLLKSLEEHVETEKSDIKKNYNDDIVAECLVKNNLEEPKSNDQDVEPECLIKNNSTELEEKSDTSQIDESFVKKDEDIVAECPIKYNSTDLKEPSNSEEKSDTNKIADLSLISVKSNSEKSQLKIKKNLWVGLKHADDDEVPPDNVKSPSITEQIQDDFLTECLKLKNKILEDFIAVKEEPNISEEIKKEERIILKGKKRIQKKQVNSDNNEIQEDKIKNIEPTNETHSKSVTSYEDDSESISSNVSPKECTAESDSKNVSTESIGRSINPVAETEEPRREFLLASSAKEGNIYIWRAGTDGRMQTLLQLPKRTQRKKNDNIWITLCWVTPTRLLSSSRNGELLNWTLPKPKDPNQQYKLIHNDHGSLLFNIVAPLQLMNEYNWNNEVQQGNVWTFGQDRLLLNTSLGKTRKTLACYPTFGGQVTYLTNSTLDPNRLAIGTGEGIIKVWDLSRPHNKNIIMSHFFNKIQSSISALCWHPVNEQILAFGTVEGRIGYFNPNNTSKSPTLLCQFFKSQIYNIEYAPLNNKSDTLGLYAVSEGKLMVFNVTSNEKEPVEVDTPDKTFAYMFAWKPDYTKLVVSTKAKTLLVYSSDLKLQTTHYINKKFERILWHPDSSNNKFEDSTYFHTFAAINNNKECILLKLKENENGEDTLSVVSTLKGHSELIHSVAWNPFDKNQLVTVGDDGFAQVWNTETETSIATYSNPNFEPLLSVVWSPLETNFIITGGKDYTLTMWNLSDYPPKDLQELEQIRKKKIKEIIKESTGLSPKLVKTVDTQKTKAKKHNKSILLSSFYTPKDADSHIDDISKLLNWKENGPQPVEEIVNPNKQQTDILKIFGSSSDMMDILDLNQKEHLKKGKYSLSNLLGMYKGNLDVCINSAIEEKRVTPSIIAIAPMVSIKTWQKACSVYAEQLTEQTDSDPLETVSYLLAVHNVDKAVEVLCENNLYREALALAKARFSEDNSVTNYILEKWANYGVLSGNYEVAAQCYVLLGRYDEGAQILIRRKSEKALKLASELAERCKDPELRKTILNMYNCPPVECDIFDKSVEEVQIIKSVSTSEQDDVKKPFLQNILDSLLNQ